MSNYCEKTLVILLFGEDRYCYLYCVEVEGTKWVQEVHKEVGIRTASHSFISEIFYNVGDMAAFAGAFEFSIRLRHLSGERSSKTIIIPAFQALALCNKSRGKLLDFSPIFLLCEWPGAETISR